MLPQAVNQLADVGPLHQSAERQADALGPVGDEPGPSSASLYLLLPSLSNSPPSLSVSTSQYTFPDVSVIVFWHQQIVQITIANFIYCNIKPKCYLCLFYFFFCPTAGLSISCLWFTDGVLMAKENHSAFKEWTFRSTGWLWRGTFSNVKQSHLQ